MEHCLSSRCESRTRPFAGRSLKLFAATLTAAAIVSVAQPAEAAVAAVINGKLVELAVREVVHGRPVKNLDALANPQALDYFKALPELQE